MKILKCIICHGEVEIIDSDRSSNKKIKCCKCGFVNFNEKNKSPEILIIKRRNNNGNCQ